MLGLQIDSAWILLGTQMLFCLKENIFFEKMFHEKLCELELFEKTWHIELSIQSADSQDRLCL